METAQIDIAESLRNCYYFNSLSDEQLQALANIAHLKRFSAGEMIFSEGDKATSLYQIISGQVQIYKLSREGKEMILHLLSDGDVFAEFPFFSNLPTYPANALCLQPTVVIAIDGSAFRELAMKHPNLTLSILAQFANRLREFNALIEDLSLRSVDSRLARYLLSVSENAPDKMVKIEVHKKTLASILGTIPETLSRSFKKLSAENIISVEDQSIHILNRKLLEDLADLAS